ncbi:MAG: HEPN domain-containing protein [Candidatus Kapaibacterium sp.]|nr:MAG: HEPN domain-containing protein [Candidatus Kapabacteria bacterium]
MVNEFFLKAEENLQGAQLLCDARLYNAATNRAYYAAFQAALAMIQMKGLQANTDHAKVQATFNGEVIRRSKHISVSFKRYLLTMQDARNLADYYPTMLSRQKAEKQLLMAKEFINVIRMELEQQ